MKICKIPTEKKNLDITLTRDSEIFDYKQSDVRRSSFLFHIESKASISYSKRNQFVLAPYDGRCVLCMFAEIKCPPYA